MYGRGLDAGTLWRAIRFVWVPAACLEGLAFWCAIATFSMQFVLGQFLLGGTKLPFSSLTDPVEIARAQAALDAAWEQIRPSLYEGQDLERERQRLAYIVANLVMVALDDEDLARRALEKFKLHA